MTAFEDAVKDSKKLTSKPSNDDLLELYGLSPPFSHFFYIYIFLFMFFFSFLPLLRMQDKFRSLRE